MLLLGGGGQYLIYRGYRKEGCCCWVGAGGWGAISSYTAAILPCCQTHILKKFAVFFRAFTEELEGGLAQHASSNTGTGLGFMGYFMVCVAPVLCPLWVSIARTGILYYQSYWGLYWLFAFEPRVIEQIT